MKKFVFLLFFLTCAVLPTSVKAGKILETKSMSASAISVMNYGALQPMGKCAILSDIVIRKGQTAIHPLAQDANESGCLHVSGNLNLQDPIQLDDISNSVRITAFDFSGNRLKSISTDGIGDVYPANLGINKPGFYFLRIESRSEIKTVKLRINH